MKPLQVLLIASLAVPAVCQQDAGRPNKESRLMRFSGTYCAVREAKQVVVRDMEGLDKLLGTMAPIPPDRRFAKPDFKTQTVVAVFLGAKSTGGWTVEIGEAKVKKDEAVVEAIVTKPGPGTIVTQAFTYPFAVRAFPKLPAKVRFEFTERER
jgi:hypothetical protein